MAKNDDVAIVENTTEVQEINLEQKVTIKNMQDGQLALSVLKVMVMSLFHLRVLQD